MDAQAKKRAIYRAKLNAQKLEKRIDSPLVRYNESDQPVCRVCDVVLKSESVWPAHQASRKHHEAITNVKSKAAGLTNVNIVKTEPPVQLHDAIPGPSAGSLKPRVSSVPPDFFDHQDTKKRKIGMDTARLGSPDSSKREGANAETEVMESFVLNGKIDGFSTAKVIETKDNEIEPAGEKIQASQTSVHSEAKQVKGALPEGFFDDKNADLRARGITPVKLDVKDEYKEFEKLIQEDLQEVDNRLEEEEYDAAEMIDEAEFLEQKACRERMQMWKEKKMEVKASKSATHIRNPEVVGKESHGDTSSDDDSDENFAVDWRAKHL